MTSPALVLMVIFVLIPLLMGVNLSLTNWNGYSQEYDYIGLKNFQRLFTDPMFQRAVINTLVYGVGSTFLQTVLGLSYALLLNKKFFLKSTMQTIVYLPAMLSSILVGYVWCFMVEYSHGALNDIVLLLGGGKDRLDGKRQPGSGDNYYSEYA